MALENSLPRTLASASSSRSGAESVARWARTRSMTSFEGSRSRAARECARRKPPAWGSMSPRPASSSTRLRTKSGSPSARAHSTGASSGGEVVTGEAVVEPLLDVLRGQRAEREVAPLAGGAQVDHARVQGRVLGLDFRGAAGADDQDALTHAAATEVAQQLHAGRVGPVKVLEQHDDGKQARGGLHEVAGLADQALASRSRGLSVQRAVGVGDERGGHQHAHRGRPGSHQVDRMLAALAGAEEPSHRVEERLQRLARSVALHAAARDHGQCERPRRARAAGTRRRAPSCRCRARRSRRRLRRRRTWPLSGAPRARRARLCRPARNSPALGGALRGASGGAAAGAAAAWSASAIVLRRGEALDGIFGERTAQHRVERA